MYRSTRSTEVPKYLKYRSAEAPKSSTTRAGRQRAITAQGELGFTAAAADVGDSPGRPPGNHLH